MPAVDTFDVLFERYEQIGSRRAVATDASRGPYQRRQTQSSKSRNTGEAKVRAWRLSSDAAPFRDEVRLRELWSKSIAGSLLVTWTPPGARSAIEVSMLSIRHEQSSAHAFQLEAVLEEAI